MKRLDVWLRGRQIAVLTEDRGAMSMTYGEQAGALGSPQVSMAMPVSSRRYGNKIARPFFHGVLPEGEARSIIAYDLGLDSGDDMALLAALGKDCAGALTIQSEQDAPPTASAPVGDDVLYSDDVGRLIAALPVHPLGFDGGSIRVSLAGVQPKLVLSRKPDGTWYLPVNGAISTHILKPASRVLPRSVENEAFCMLLAAHAGLRAAPTTVEHFGGAPVLVSQRYDRVVDASGSVERLHQEDACQALSILTATPSRKYQRHSANLSLRVISRLLEQWADLGAIEELLTHVVFHALIGNADYHGKNVSFLHLEDGSVRLAPIYDAMCTVFYTGADGGPLVDTELGLFVVNKTDINAVTNGDLVEEAVPWGIRRARAQQLIAELLERLPDAIDRAAEMVPGVPEPLVAMIRSRAEVLRGT
jgi:serine/threonine-protein kinase HipA